MFLSVCGECFAADEKITLSLDPGQSLKLQELETCLLSDLKANENIKLSQDDADLNISISEGRSFIAGEALQTITVKVDHPRYLHPERNPPFREKMIAYTPSHFESKDFKKSMTRLCKEIGQGLEDHVWALQEKRMKSSKVYSDRHPHFPHTF